MLNTSRRTIATLTAAACLGAGGWALAGGSSNPAASTGSNGSTTTLTAGRDGGPSGAARTPLTADQLAKITAAVTAKLPGATVDRARASADGFHAHVTTSDDASKRVTLSSDFAVTEIADAPAGGGPGGRDCPNGPGGAPGGAPAPDGGPTIPAPATTPSTDTTSTL